jgi:hypothetical protein
MSAEVECPKADSPSSPLSLPVPSSVSSYESIWRLAEWGLTAAVCLLALGVIWLPALPPAADFPNHLLAVVVHTWPERFVGLLEPNLPLTASGFIAPMLVLVPTLDPIVAARLLLTAYAVVAGFSAAWIARRLGHHVCLAAAGSMLLVLGWPWAMGFWNYVAALVIALGASAVWVSQPPRLQTRLIVAALLLVAALCHTPGAIIGTCWTLWMLRAIRSGRAWWADAAVLLAPGGLLVLSTFLRAGKGGEQLPGFTSTALEWSPAGERVQQLLSLSVDGYSPIAGLVCVAAWLTLAFRLWRVRGQGGVPLHASRIALSGVGLGVLVFLCLPLHLPIWSFFSPRVLPPLLVAGLVHSPSPRNRFDRVMAMLLLAALAVSMTLSLRNTMDAGDYTARVLGQMPTSPPGRVYSAIVGTESPGYHPPYVRVAVGLASYVTAAGGGWPGAFALDPDIHSMTFARPVELLFPRSNPWREWSTACVLDPECANPTGWADAIAVEALTWDTAFVGGITQPMTQRLTLRGYVAETNTIWHPRPAELRLDVFDVPSMASERPILVELHWPDTLGLIWSGVVPVAARRPRTIHPLRVQIPAGPALLVTCEDSNADGRCTSADTSLQSLQMEFRSGANAAVPCGPGRLAGERLAQPDEQPND